MLISVTLASSSSSSAGAAKLPSGLAKLSNDEIVLIELQGSLEVEATHPSERNGKFVGTLTMDEAGNKPTLLIGNHLLEGKVASLPKPFAVLVRKEHKRSSPRNGKTSFGGDEDGYEDQDSADQEPMAVDMDSAPDGAGASAVVGEPGPGWNIAGIVKKKIIFSKRPMPVAGKR